MMILIVGCAKKEHPTNAGSSASEPVAPTFSPSSATIASPPPTNVSVFRLSGAKFGKGARLEQCVDFFTRTEGGDGGSSNEHEVRKLFKAEKLTTLSKPCLEQFSDRTVLASCAFEKTSSDAGVQKTVGGQEHYYDFAALDSDDTYMKDCIEMHGTWKAVDRTSVEWKRAKLDHSRKNLERAQDELKKLADDPE